MSSARSARSSLHPWLQAIVDLPPVQVISTFIMWVFGAHFIRPEDAYPTVVRKSLLSCIPALMIFAGPFIYNLVCMYGTDFGREETTRNEIIALWLYNGGMMFWLVTSGFYGIYSRMTGTFKPALFEAFFVTSTFVNGLNSITNEANPTICFTTAITVVSVSGEMRNTPLFVFLNMLVMAIYMANVTTGNKLMVPHYHGAFGNAIMPVWYERMYHCIMGFAAYIITFVVPGLAGVVISRESAKLRGAFGLSKRLARLTKSYDVDGMRAALQRYEMDPGCDLELLTTQKAVLDNLEKYRPHIPAYMIESASSNDSEVEARRRTRRDGRSGSADDDEEDDEGDLILEDEEDRDNDSVDDFGERYESGNYCGKLATKSSVVSGGNKAIHGVGSSFSYATSSRSPEGGGGKYGADDHLSATDASTATSAGISAQNLYATSSHTPQSPQQLGGSGAVEKQRQRDWTSGGRRTDGGRSGARKAARITTLIAAAAGMSGSKSPLFSGVVSVMRVSFHTAAQFFGVPPVAAGGAAGVTRELTDVFKSRVRAVRRATESLLLDCFRAAESTQGSVLSAIGDEITVAWNATRRAARPGVKTCQFATLMRDAPRQANRHLTIAASRSHSPSQSFNHGGNGNNGRPAGGGMVPHEQSSNSMASLLRSTASAGGAASAAFPATVLLVSAHATTTRAHCFSGGDSKQRLMMVLELGLFHSRMMGLGRLARDLAFFAAARNDGVPAPLQVVVDRATQDAAQFSHRFRPIGFLFGASPAAPTGAVSGRPPATSLVEPLSPTNLLPLLSPPHARPHAAAQAAVNNTFNDRNYSLDTDAAAQDVHTVSIASLSQGVAGSPAFGFGTPSSHPTAAAVPTSPQQIHPPSVPQYSTAAIGEAHVQIPAADRVAYELVGEQSKQKDGAFDEWMYEVAAVDLPTAPNAQGKPGMPGPSVTAGASPVRAATTHPTQAMTLAAAAVANGADPVAALRQMQASCPAGDLSAGYLFFEAQLADRSRDAMWR